MRPTPALRLLVAHALGATALSLPWPSLLAQVFTATRSDGWVGLAGAGRMLPYVLLSALAGALADRVDRATVLRWSTGVRTVLLGGSAACVATGRLGAGVLLTVLAVAAATPAYPAAVAALPRLAPVGTERWTAWLVTVEVTAFVVGPALGGVLLGAGAGRWSLPTAVVLGTLSLGLLLGLGSSPAPTRSTPVRAGTGPADLPAAVSRATDPGRLRAVLGAPGVPGVIGLVALVNLVDAAAAVALLRLSADRWRAGEAGFGVATAALGFGALGAPLLRRLVGHRGALRAGGTGLLVAGAVPVAGAATAPLALVGAASTVVECVATATLQRSVPDRFRAFSLGLTDSVMVGAAALGALAGPALVGALGALPAFGCLGLLLVATAAVPVRAGRLGARRPVRSPAVRPTRRAQQRV